MVNITKINILRKYFQLFHGHWSKFKKNILSKRKSYLNGKNNFPNKKKVKISLTIHISY